MKVKSVILEILIILASLIMTAYVIKVQIDLHKPIEDIVIKSIIALISVPALYWRMKVKVQSSNLINPEKTIRIWQYLILGLIASGVLFEVLVSYNVSERSVKDLGFLWLVWMIIYGNFRAKIEPFFEEPLYFFVDDVEIQRQTKRFSGKLLVFGGISSIILLLILPENLIGYVLLAYLFSFFIVPFVYGKIIQRRKLA